MPPLGVPGLEDSRSSDLTTFTVKVDGEALPDTYSLVAIDIVRAVNRIPTVSLVLYDGDPATQDFEVSSGDVLVPGKEIEVEGGYGGDQELLFKGVITKQRIQVKRKGESLLRIEARDAAFRMTLDRKSKYFTELKDSDLFEEIISQYGDLQPQVEATTATHPAAVQYQVSDWDFIVARAERLSMFCLPEDGTVRIEKPNPEQEAVLNLAYGTGIFDLDMEMDARWQYPSVTASAWDHANQELISSDVDDVPAPGQGDLDGPTLSETGAVASFELRHSGALKQQDLDAWAEAQMIKSRFAKIRGTIRFQGTAGVKPGDLVALDGLGGRFNGNAFVSGTHQMLGDGDWETVVELGLDPAWHHQNFPVDAPAASGFSAAVNGLQIGVVTQLQDDPEGEDRILVRLPIIAPDDPGTWARLATLDAEENQGTVFRPELGAEVVVGFLNDDPHHPVILGMLHGSSKPAPISASDDNHEKGLVTRSGMKIIFNDDDPSLSIETPNGNKIALSDSDGRIQISEESGNTVTIDSNGIALESPADIVLKATGDISIEGSNVDVKAMVSLTTEGSASAALKSGGTMEVKGALVQIN